MMGRKLQLYNMNNELYKDEINAFLGEDGIQYLKEYYDEDKLALPWGSVFYGRIGMQVRNYLRSKHPEIDEEMKDYSDFEDWSWNVINEIMEELEKQTQK